MAAWSSLVFIADLDNIFWGLRNWRIDGLVMLGRKTWNFR
jgi:hypothetical protein